jgi:serine/threonine protein kinase/class 3 adenylate cyclase
MVLMFTDIVGSVDLKRRLGDGAAADLIRRHDRLFRHTVKAFSFAEILKDLGDGFLARFASASDAVHAALAFQHALLADEQWQGERIKVRIGLHLGEVSELSKGDTEGGGPAKISGLAVDIAARVMSLALPGQILMTRAAFDNARQYVREQGGANTDGSGGADGVYKWMAHGRYLFHGADEPLEVFEVGASGLAPLRVPPDTEKARRAVAADQEETLGWRPAIGLEVPERRHWVLERKLGEGGFGEVWLAENTRTHDRRVIKFCFDPDRLRSFKRELMFFRLLREALGDRQDIAKLFEVQVEKPPFYLESEFTEDGSLVEWSAREGAIKQVPLATRLDIVARTALAVAAAHSVGVLHKDIKPSNILVARGPQGEPRPRLTDFGIGVLADPAQLLNRNITMIGITESAIGADLSRTGTRMYSPPETLQGKPFTVQGDVYALGVVLYQMVVGDLDRPLAQGWERDVTDPLLREDIARCVEGHEDERLGSAKELAERLQTLPARRRALRRRRFARMATITSVLMAALLSLAGLWLVRETRLRVQKEREAEKAIAISQEWQGMFSAVDARLPQEQRGRNVKVADTLDLAVTKLDKKSQEPEVEAALRWAIGNAYKNLGLLGPAEIQLQQALDTRRQILGSDHLDVAQSLHDLGSVKWLRDEFEGARPLFEEALRIRHAHFTGDHLEIASSLNYLAACLNSMKQHAEAESLYRQALAMRERLAAALESSPSPDDEEVSGRKELVARSMNNLGTCLRDQADDGEVKTLDEAETLFVKALDLVRRQRGDDYVDVANGLNNLGSFYLLYKGNLERAEQPLVEALATKRKIHGDQHYSVAVTLQFLAELSCAQERYAEAEQYAREAVDIRRQVFPEGHPQITESLDWLAIALIGQKRSDDAAPVLREAKRNREQDTGPDETDTTRDAGRLGAHLLEQKRYAAAEPLLQRSYDLCRESSSGGERDARTIEAAKRLASLYDATGRSAEAQSLRNGLASSNGSP